MEQKNASFNLLVSRRFLSEERNGISRDAEAIIFGLRNANHISLLELEPVINVSQKVSVPRIVRIITTIVLRKPSYYESNKSFSFIPQLQNLLPKKESTAFIRIHDIFPVTNPGWYRYLSALSFKITLGHAIRGGHKFVCNSNYTKNELTKKYPSVNAEVLYCYPNRSPSESCNQCEFCTAPESFDYRFLIAVGTIEPRKNYSGLINAWKISCSSTGEKLIVVGRYGWKAKRVYKKLHSVKNIIHIEEACNYAVNQLLLKSRAFISCSFEEGFDFPSIDAALLHKSVLLSDIPVHRELHGEGAIYFNPRNDIQIKNAIDSDCNGYSNLSLEFISSTKHFQENLMKIFDA